MRKAVRAIVVKDKQILLMHRNKFGKEYYSLVGGGIDAGETPIEALYREVDEESSISIDNHRLVIIEDAGDIYGVQYIYLCDYVSGDPKLSPQSEEAQIHALGHNLYEPVWMPIKDIHKLPLLPRELKDSVIHGLKHGFPVEPLSLKIRD